MTRVRILSEFTAGFSTAFRRYAEGEVVDVDRAVAEGWRDLGRAEIVLLEEVPPPAPVEVVVASPVAEVPVEFHRPGAYRGQKATKKGR